MRSAPRLTPVGVLLVFALAAPSLAQDWSGRGRVNGIVNDDASKKPIVGATVTLRLLNQPEQGPPPITTDKKGRWSYLGLLGGDWIVQIDAEGHVPSQGQVHVNEFGVNPMLTIALRTMEAVAPAAAKVDPALAAAQEAVDRGDALLQEKKATEARAEYEKALPLFEGNNRVIILKRIGTCQMIEGNDEGAVQTFKDVLAAVPGDPDSLRLIVDRLIILKRDAEAQQYMAQLPQGQGLDPNTMLNMGINLYNDNKLDEAIVKFNDVIAARPDHADGYYYRGLTLLAKNKMAEAKADFLKVLEIDPNGQFASDSRGFLKSL